MGKYKTYRLYDMYDGFDNRILVCQSDSIHEVTSAAIRWNIEETDGECDLYLYRYLESEHKYRLVSSWTY